MQNQTQIEPCRGPDSGDARRALGAGLALCAACGLGVVAGLVGCASTGEVALAEDEDAVRVSLSDLIEEDGGAGEEAQVEASPDGASDSEFEAMIEAQAAQLAEAYSSQTNVAQEDEANSGLAGMFESGEMPVSTGADSTEGASVEAMEDGGDASGDASVLTEAAEPDEVVAPLSLDVLYARLDEAIGQELDSTSEPFRMAVAMIALAAAQGNDPIAAIAPETKVGAALSPTERVSAEIVADLLDSMLGTAIESPDRAAAMRDLSDRLAASAGLSIPRVALCTEVRGFGRYTPFPRNSFLAGQPIRALLYVELDRFEHREVSSEGMGLEIEEPWAIEVGQTLELHHAGGEILAWKRGEEIVVETSRNKQRDFYLLTDIQLPQTLTVGSYQLKVILRDRVSGEVAEALVPIGVVADPALAWTSG